MLYGQLHLTNSSVTHTTPLNPGLDIAQLKAKITKATTKTILDSNRECLITNLSNQKKDANFSWSFMK